MKIKYDLKTNKILLITTIVSAVIFLLAIIGIFIEIQGTEIAVLFALYIGGGLFLFSALNLFAGVCYIRRLKLHGYEIPYNKNEYNDDLRNVPCNKEQNTISDVNKGSRLLSRVYFAVFILAGIWNTYYIVHWYHLIKDNSVFLLVIQIILDLWWLILSIKCYKQTNNKKYKDDVELNFDKKERIPIENGIILCVILLCTTILSKVIAYNMSDYVMRSMEKQEKMSCVDAQMYVDYDEEVSI